MITVLRGELGHRNDEIIRRNERERETNILIRGLPNLVLQLQPGRARTADVLDDDPIMKSGEGAQLSNLRTSSRNLDNLGFACRKTDIVRRVRMIVADGSRSPRVARYEATPSNFAQKDCELPSYPAREQISLDIETRPIAKLVGHVRYGSIEPLTPTIAPTFAS